MHLRTLLRFATTLMLPLAFFKGTWESSTTWSQLPLPKCAYLACLPLILLACLADILYFNRPYFAAIFERRLLSSWHCVLHFCVEAALCSLTLVCCWAVGVVWFHVWTIMHGASALSMATLGLLILATFYVNVTSQRPYSPSSESPINEGDKQVFVAPAESDIHSQVPNLTETASNEEHGDFDWTWPSKKLDSLAGMTDLKTALNEVLNGLHIVRQGAPAERNGILLSGPPGNGKTTVAACLAAELGLPMITVGAADLTSKWINESPQKIKSLFKAAARQQCVVFIDEFDSVGQSRGNGQQHGEDRKVVNTLLAQIDAARKLPIVLIAATNFPEQLDEALVRDGRFDFRVEIPLPDTAARLGILRDQLAQLNVLAPYPALQKVALLWERRPISFIRSCSLQVRDLVRARDGYVANLDDFKAAASNVSRKPTALAPAGPKLNDIFLTSNVREQMNSLVFRLKNWESIAERGGEAPSGVLLYGPAGTGKTLLVQSLARELGWHVFEVKGGVVTGDPKELQTTIELAYTHRPAIVFLDEADEVLADRSTRITNCACNQILKAMDGAGGRVPEVLFVAATNRMKAIDPAALRPGRFGEKIYMGPLAGADLVNFFTMEFRKKDRVQFAQDLTPQTLAAILGQATPAHAASVLRMAINASFANGDLTEVVGLMHVHAAISTFMAND
jgi:transitional endoplasmic reticulum ATPase